MSRVHTSENHSKMEVVYNDWDASGRLVRAWSAPVAARHGKVWEFFVKGDLVSFSTEPDTWFVIRPEDFRRT